jgi:hypothetical protein
MKSKYNCHLEFSTVKHPVRVLLLVVLCIVQPLTAGEFYLLANLPPKVDLDQDYGLSLLRGDNKNWDNGTDARAALPSRASPHYDTAAETLIEGTGKALERRWFRLVFSGKVNAPQYFDSDQAIIDYVANNSGAIGIVATQVGSVDGVVVVKIP